MITKQQHRAGRRTTTAGVLTFAATVLLLEACGAGMGAARHAMAAGSRKNNEAHQVDTSTAIVQAQEAAIGKAQGGKADFVIAWTEPKSGLQGTIVLDPAVLLTYSCHRYRQSMSFGTETLNGILTACPQGDGTWKLVATTP